MTRTVVLRLFEPAPATGAVELRGVVEDVARHSTERFAGTAELIAALQRIATNTASHPETLEPIDPT